MLGEFPWGKSPIVGQITKILVAFWFAGRLLGLIIWAQQFVELLFKAFHGGFRQEKGVLAA